MIPTLRQKVLTHLAVLAQTPKANVDERRQALAQLPLTTVEELLAETSDGDWPLADRQRLFEILSYDPRPLVKLGVAWGVLGTGLVNQTAWVIPVITRLAHQAQGVTLMAVAQALAQTLRLADQKLHLWIIATWISQRSPSLRATMAHALAWPYPVDGAEHALHLLRRDPAPSVRLGVAIAACARFVENPIRYGRLLKQFATDPHPLVRRIARSALGARRSKRTC